MIRKRNFGIVYLSFVVGLVLSFLLMGCDLNGTEGGKTGGNENLKNAVVLTKNVWADGDISNGVKEQWFKFTASSSKQYIHIDFGTLNKIDVQLYKSDGEKEGVLKNLSGDTDNAFFYTTIGNTYYVKVTPNNSYNSGTYRITFNSVEYSPKVFDGALTLEENTWKDGNISNSVKENWFKFTAAAAVQYIHFDFGTLRYGYVRLYDNTGAILGPEKNQGSDDKSLSSTDLIYSDGPELTPGQEYYLNVRSIANSSGTYRIAFNAESVPPLILGSAVTLAINEWKDLYISANERDLFKFTASAVTQYIHIKFSTLENVNVALCDSTGTVLDDAVNLSGDAASTSFTELEIGQEYYVNVTPHDNGDSGSYKIAFNSAPYSPDVFAGASTLTKDSWENANISEKPENWFRIRATDSIQYYLHIMFDTLNNIDIVIYDNTGAALGPDVNLHGNTNYTSFSAIKNDVYFVKVTAHTNADTGSCQIAFNAESSRPKTPFEKAVVLESNKWEYNSLKEAENWFIFTARAARQYIHAKSLTQDMYVQLCNSSGEALVEHKIMSKSTSGSYLNFTELTIEEDYYVKVTPSGSNTKTDSYNIAVNGIVYSPDNFILDYNSEITPNDRIGDFLIGKKVTGSVAAKWFKFKAKNNGTQYIQTVLGPQISSITTYFYSDTGDELGSGTSLPNAVKGKTYYIRVYPYTGIGITPAYVSYEIFVYDETFNP